MMALHAAKIGRSPRLQRILAFLRSRGSMGATTMEIQEAVHGCAVGTCISEIRKNGFRITCDFVMRTDTGAKVYRYTLDERLFTGTGP